MAGSGSIKLLFRPCAAVCTAVSRRGLVVGQAKRAFLVQVLQSRNVFMGRPMGISHLVAVKKSWEFRCFSGSGHQVNDAGAIDDSLMQSMEKKIRDELNAESVIVKDAYGDGRHVSIDVVSSGFEGQSAVNRQRMVYKAIWQELQTTVHAVDQMTTRTPSEAGMSK